MTTLIEKSCGNLTLSVAPELGGAIAALNWRGEPILRPLDLNGKQRANLCGSYPLIPWSNRIAESQFTFAGRSWNVAKNFGDHPHAIHGNGWKTPWKMAAETPDSVLLEMQHEASEAWPWPYEARQLIELDSNSLRISMTYVNRADIAVPVGLGFHPFFAHAAESEICFVAKNVWLNDANALPCKESEIPERWNYRVFRQPQFGSVDNCFTGWSGSATVRWPGRGLTATISSTNMFNAVLFIPPAERNVVAIEPVSNINNAINLLPAGSSNQAMTRVQPGEHFTVSMEIRIADHASA